MSTNQKRERLQELRDLPQPRDPVHEAEFAALVKELQSLEAESLSAASQRMKREREETDARNRTLENLAARRIALLTRLEGTLSDARAERQVIDGELASVLAGLPGAAGE